MKRILSAALFAAAATFASCTPDKQTEEAEVAEEATTADQTVVAPVDTTLTEEKKELLQHIAQHTMLQLELNKLAVERATTPEAKEYAQEIVRIYTPRINELQELAGTYNVALETALNNEYRDKYLEGLGDEKGVAFDKEYWEHLVDAQKETLDEYEDVVKDITEADGTPFGIWARTSEKELRAQYEQALARQLELKNNT